jgi:hypothetical protein
LNGHIDDEEAAKQALIVVKDYGAGHIVLMKHLDNA